MTTNPGSVGSPTVEVVMTMANKYHAKKWGKYDSKKEAKRAQELKALEAAGLISDLREQVPLELIPAQWTEIPRTGKKGQPLKPKRKCLERACTYIADFVYKQNGVEIWEDVKSPVTRTPEYKIKRKLALYLKGIKIKEI